MVKICQVVSEYSGLYITHMRSEADQLIEGVEEALEIGRRANLPVGIYHLKAAGKRNWPKMAEVIALIDKARSSNSEFGQRGQSFRQLLAKNEVRSAVKGLFWPR